MSTTATLETVTPQDDFFVIAREPGAEHPALPTWASRSQNPAALAEQASQAVSRRDIAEVPGAFQLLNVFSQEECRRLIDISETLGYLPDAAVSLPRQVRHNDSLTWVVDEITEGLIWQRCRDLAQDLNGDFGGREAVGINRRFRFYRYGEGDFFQFHTDGAWPGSRIDDNQLISNGYPDRYSEMTFLVLLSEDFEGGATRFRLNADDPLLQPRRDSVVDIDVRTPAGAVLCFPHGMHPLHRVHSSTLITAGIKYIIRTDMLFLQE
ncbi:oxidoreductase [Microbulbifer sp. ZKSA006]|uniref:oxidoreductase n=1 Tax=Microbulbifer sp. ZKSA006 TaxID=3243390 RepID=UPI004039B537